MDWYEDLNVVPGKFPDFGAIFMCSNETKRECFQRELFGMPPSQISFVRQVKAGMTLFLFEYERRQLYGVFQACSDGAINIVPHAFRSSGKQFPGQVKISTIWNCNPLSEHEFRDVIKDNYFSANKFNFGLSENQVHRLLVLFSSRKLKQHLPLRQLTRRVVARPSGKALPKVRRVVDNDKFILRDKVENDYEVGNELDSLTSTEFSGPSFGKKRRIIGDSFPTQYRVGNSEHVVGSYLEPSIPTEYSGHALDRDKTVPDDGRCATSYEVGNKYYMDNDFGPVISRNHPGNLSSEVRRVADDGRFTKNYKLGNKCNVGNNSVSREYHGNTFGDVRRVADNGRFTTSDRFEDDCNVDNGLGSDILSGYFGNSLNKVKRVADDDMFTSDRIENELNLDIGLEPVASISLYQSNPNPSVYFRNDIVERNNSLGPDQPMPSAFSSPMEPQTSKLYNSAFHGDAIFSSPLRYDPDSPSIQYRSSSSFADDQISSFVKECLPPGYNSVGDIPSRNQSFQFHMQPQALSKHPYGTPGIGNHITLSSPNICKCADCMTGIPSSRVGCSERKGIDSDTYEGLNDLSYANSSFSPMPFARSGTYSLKNPNHSYSFSPSKIPSFVSDHGYPVVLNEKHEHETPWRKSNEALTANVSSPRGKQFKFQARGGFLESRDLNCHENSAFNHDVEYHRHRAENSAFNHDVQLSRATKGFDGDLQKNRNSVFSRLSVAPEVNQKKSFIHKGSDEYDLDISVGEVMDMLHQGQCCWGDKARKSKLLIGKPYDGENLMDQRHTTFYNQKLKNDSRQIPKNVSMNCTPAKEDDFDLLAQRTPLVDFKRRSEVRKNVDENQSRGYIGVTESVDSSAKQCKRRKLVRPNFRNDSFNDTGNGDNSTDVCGLELTSLFTDKTDSSESLIKIQVNGNNLAQCVELPIKATGNNLTQCPELPCAIDQVSSSGSDTVKNRSSVSEGERKRENPEESFKGGDENGNNLTQCVELPCAIDQVSSAGSDTAKNRSSVSEGERKRENPEEFFKGGDENGNNLTQCVELPCAIDQVSSAGSDTAKNGSSVCEGERKRENSEESLKGSDTAKIKNGSSVCEVEREPEPENSEESFKGEDGNGKHLSQNIGLENVLVSGEDDCRNADKDSSSKDVMVDGLSKDHHNTSSLNEQKPSLQIHEVDAAKCITLVETLKKDI